VNIIEKITESIFFKDLIAKINSLIDNSNELGGKVEFLEEIDTSKFEYLDKLEEVDSKASKTELSNAVTTHNTSETAHNDIRLLIQGLTTRLNALADSDDVTLDQMSEVVAYIKANKSLIESITTDKVNVSDIINNLETNATNKPLSAAQGVALKQLVDAIYDAKNSGELDGYTPVKGTDYWTEEDRAEIIAELSTECISKNQGTDNVGKILVVGADGNLTLMDIP